mmetsp:Transcript_41121/g.130655  ORF Transcript_41121/g.130655 Transcript_41121/m.130655 type:complete len:503 (-) Transcript_41121:81-1589(-)
MLPLTEEEGESVEATPPPGAGAKAPSAATPGSAARVTDFLRHIRGLSAYSGEDLDALLYECRFELLPPLKHGGAEGKRRTLPLYSDIPTQQELHDLLKGGFAPCGHQCVAHVLYPDSVPWPFDVASWAESSAKSEEHLEAPAASPPAPASPSGSSTGNRRQTFRASQGYGSMTLTPHQLEASGSFSDLDGRTGEVTRRSHQTSGGTQAESPVGDVERSGEVLLCGQRVRSTVRGKPVQEQSEELLAAADDVDDARYRAAHEKRTKAERTAKLERYHERKLLERIKYLEEMREAEVKHQDALQKREAQRQARKEELSQQLEVGYQRKLEEEKANEELHAQQKKKEAEAEQRSMRYHGKQKDLLHQWHAEHVEDYVSRETQVRLKQAELLAEKRAKAREKEKQKKTVKQVEVMEKMHRIQTAVEERPPLPPRPHDLPRPVLEVLGETAERPTPRTHRGPHPGSWVIQAKAVSNMYGLNEKEHAAVEDQLRRGVRGAGRMGVYDK